MPDSDVQITAGSGTKIDTRTVGTGADEHRQVIVIGDPNTAGAVAPVDATFGLDVDRHEHRYNARIPHKSATSIYSLPFRRKG